jgi:hypothetical protein
MIDGESDGDGLFADTLVADLSKQTIGTEVETATTLGDRHDVGTEPVTAFGLAEEAGFPPDDIGPESSLRVVVGQVQAGEFEEGPEHRLIVQQLLAGIPGPRTSVRLLALLESQAKIMAGSDSASSIVLGMIPALSPAVLELNDEAGELDEPEA